MHRRSYADDPALCDAVFALLDTWIPTLSRARRNAEALRWRWEHCSTPFVAFREGRVASHVGVLETRLVSGDHVVRTGGLHAVCTLAAFRRQGLYRAIMEEVLAWCDARFPLLKLSTEHPEYYEPFGFRVIPEHHFRLRVDARRGREGFRQLDRANEQDLDLLDRLLATRVPVSQILATEADEKVWKFNAGGVPVHYCEALDLIAVMTLRGTTLEIDDLVGASLPDVPTLLSEIQPPVREVLFRFRPDRLGVEAEPERTRYDGDVLMFRGDFPEAGNPPRELMLSPMARH